MNRTMAVARLGLSGEADALSVTRAYGERLGMLQQQLVAARNDQERNDSQVQLAELIDAYEFLTQTGRHARTQNEDVTKARPAGEVPTQIGPRDAAICMEPGAVLSDRLEIGPMLGQGGMGNVYAARDRLKNENVAIKVLRQDLLFSSAAKERFLAEAKVSCNFSHPNIVNVYDVGVSGGNYYFSMELLKGQTLRQRIERYHRDRRLFTVAEVNEITRQLVDALRYAHRYIVHRDIKPENIWLEQDGTVKLMDFGIARAYSNSDMTQTGMTLGTAYYMAPEQRTDAKEVDWRADQYSLGIVLYELMAGTVPMGAARPLEQLRRDLPRRYARALMRAISPRPEDRWPSLQEFLAELHLRQRRAVWPVAAAVAGMAIATAAAGGIYIYRNLDQVETVQVPVTKGTQGTSNGLEPPPPRAKSNSGGEVDPKAAGGADTQPGLQAGGAQSSGTQTGDPQAGVGSTMSNASTAPDSRSDAIVQLPKPDRLPPKVQTGTGAVAVVSQQVQPRSTQNGSGSAAGDADALRREQCLTQCGRDDGECRSINRRGKQECLKVGAFGGSSVAAAGNNCKFFGQERCQLAADREACLSRMAGRYAECMRTTGGSMSNIRQDCDKVSRDADQLCLSQLRECRVSCQ
jgi:tRNA A-37 threonylcarbamoyl transferase component Bud32